MQFSKEKYILDSSPEKLHKELEEELKLNSTDLRSHAWYHGRIPREVSGPQAGISALAPSTHTLANLGLAPVTPESLACPLVRLRFIFTIYCVTLRECHHLSGPVLPTMERMSPPKAVVDSLVRPCVKRRDYGQGEVS